MTRAAPEAAIQTAFADLMRAGAGPRVMWHSIPNERQASPAIGAQLKRMGLRPGCADVLVWWTKPLPLVAYVEFKAPGGRLTETQRRFARDARDAGASVLVHTDAAEAYRDLAALGAPFARRLDAAGNLRLAGALAAEGAA